MKKKGITWLIYNINITHIVKEHIKKLNNDNKNCSIKTLYLPEINTFKDNLDKILK